MPSGQGFANSKPLKKTHSINWAGVTLNETPLTLPTRLGGSQLPAPANDMGVEVHRHGGIAHGAVSAETSLDLAHRSHVAARYDWFLCQSCHLLYDAREYAVAVGVAVIG